MKKIDSHCDNVGSYVHTLVLFPFRCYYLR